MAEKVGSRQQQILNLLLENKAGLSIDEIANALNISRNAVQPHFTVLESSPVLPPFQSLRPKHWVCQT